MIKQQTEIRLVASGKYWGTLRIDAGRLLLDCQRHGKLVQFDMLASVEQQRAVGGQTVPMPPPETGLIMDENGNIRERSESPPVRYVTKSDFDKIQRIYQRLYLIWERDGVADEFRGSGHYLIRSVIEAMQLSELFYEKKTAD